MMLRVTSCGVGSLVALMASACQLVPNPALIGGDASTGVDVATSSSTSAMDGVDTTGALGSTSSGPSGSTSAGDCMEGVDSTHSYIWIANSSQGTISKINTETLVEEGRYITRPDSNGNPSRTSVSLTGNVAVANRSGGLTKLYANLDDCAGGNSSTGAGDILPWGDEGCMAWHTPMVYVSQRPVTWTQGELDMAQCAIINEKVWTAGSPDGNVVEVVLVDGETGVIDETIPIPGVQASFYGIYGAAVDAEGNFWGSQLGTGHLVNVNRQTLDVQIWPMTAGGYGMTVDHEGYVWTCSGTAARFDPVSETWAQADVGGSGGCMSDGGDILWMAASPLLGINRNTFAIEHSIVLPEYVHGISIDYQGYVWGVGMSSNAYRVDPQNGTWDMVGGLVAPYTYSDMTGFALSSAGRPSG